MCWVAVFPSLPIEFGWYWILSQPFLSLWSPPPGSLASWSHLSSSEKSWLLEFSFLNLPQLGEGDRVPPHRSQRTGASACEQCWTQTINNAATSAFEFGACAEFAAASNWLMPGADLCVRGIQTHPFSLTQNWYLWFQNALENHLVSHKMVLNSP